MVLAEDNAAVQREILAGRGVEFLARAMDAHIWDAKLQRFACGALKNVAGNNSAAQQAMSA
jgi:hypothetical protein